MTGGGEVKLTYPHREYDELVMELAVTTNSVVSFEESPNEVAEVIIKLPGEEPEEKENR
jgi:hypothetical protein